MTDGLRLMVHSRIRRAFQKESNIVVCHKIASILCFGKDLGSWHGLDILSIHSLFVTVSVTGPGG